MVASHLIPDKTQRPYGGIQGLTLSGLWYLLTSSPAELSPPHRPVPPRCSPYWSPDTPSILPLWSLCNCCPFCLEGFTQLVTWLSPSLRSGVCSNTILSKRPSLASIIDLENYPVSLTLWKFMLRRTVRCFKVRKGLSCSGKTPNDKVVINPEKKNSRLRQCNYSRQLVSAVSSL